MSSRPGDEHVLVVLAGATPRATVDVPAVALLEREPGALEDPRVEVATVVDHDHHAAPWRQRPAARGEDTRDPVDVRAERGLRRAAFRRAELALAQVLEPEQLVRVPVLLVVVDQPRVRR